MRRPHTLLATLLLAAGTAAAQDYGQAATLKIWDNTTAPHSNGIATPEREPEPNRIADVSQAVLYIFPADPAKATGQAVVICPGGGYVKLCIDYEGYDMAKWFAANGITAAVLKYRMPNGHRDCCALDDVERRNFGNARDRNNHGCNRRSAARNTGGKLHGQKHLNGI